MLKADQLTDFGKASPEDQQTIGWALSRIQIELDAYMKQGFGEPGPRDVHDLAARKVRAYINSIMRELTITHL